MGRCAEKGQVRYLGACNVSVSQVQRLRKVYPVSAVQMPYSMLSRGIEDELLEYCGREGIGVVCYSPMQKGLLTGKFTKQYLSTLPKDDHRLRDRNFTGARFEKNLAIAEQLKAVADEYGRTVAELAIAWVLRQSAVTAAIVGARKPEQIEQTAPAGNWTLNEIQINQIEKILSQ
jgi:aryl-alcohol dehydrogenase-like predicted oxidoreductase